MFHGFIAVLLPEHKGCDFFCVLLILLIILAGYMINVDNV